MCGGLNGAAAERDLCDGDDEASRRGKARNRLTTSPEEESGDGTRSRDARGTADVDRVPNVIMRSVH